MGPKFGMVYENDLLAFFYTMQNFYFDRKCIQKANTEDDLNKT